MRFPKSLLVFIVGYLASFFVLPSPAYAEEPIIQETIVTGTNITPDVYVTRLEITSVANGKVAGVLEIWNANGFVMNNLDISVELFRGTESDSFSDTIDAQILNTNLTFTPKEMKATTFVYEWPQTIAGGNYYLRVGTITDKGVYLGWKEIVVQLPQKEKDAFFLEVLPDSRKIIAKVAADEEKRDDLVCPAWSRPLLPTTPTRLEERHPLTGESIDPAGEVTAVLKLQNKQSQIALTPKIVIFNEHINSPVLQQYEEKLIDLQANEIKEIRLTMPRFSNPASYLAEITFFAQGKQVSARQYFRWVVRGEEGKILFVKPSKDIYRKGEYAKVTIDIVGPPDLCAIGKGKLKITLRGKSLDTKDSREVVISSLFEVPLGQNIFSQEVSLLVPQDIVSPTVEAELVKNELVLDTSKTEVPLFSEESKKIVEEKRMEREKEEVAQKKIILSLLALGAIGSFLVLGFLVYKKYRYRLKK